jgi:hypothetical protein
MTEEQYAYLMTGRTTEEDAKQKAFIPYYVVLEMLKGWGKMKYNEAIHNILDLKYELETDENTYYVVNVEEIKELKK